MMPLIEQADLQALGCNEHFAPSVNENLNILPIYQKVTELMFKMLNVPGYSARDVFADLLAIIRFIEIEALVPLSGMVVNHE
ncbi:MAG: hypothetical protein ACYC64_18925 [Armatimonadota bacterium]